MKESVHYHVIKTNSNTLSLKRKEIPLLSNTLTLGWPQPSEDLLFLSLFHLELHFSSRETPAPSCWTRGDEGFFSWDMADYPSPDLRWPKIVSSWLPWLVKAGNSNASAQELPISLSFFFFFPSSSKCISKEQPLTADFLIHPDWLLGALKNWHHSHGDTSTKHHMYPVTDSLWLFQKCQCSQHLRSRKENVEASNI